MPLSLEGLGRQPVTIATIVGPKSEDLPANSLPAILVDWEIGTPPATARGSCVPSPVRVPLSLLHVVPQALPNVLTGEAPEEKHT